jgi:mRNA interferase MazF
MPAPHRGEVWLVDLGLAGKTRPALVVSVPFGDQDRSLITVVQHTTSLRGSRFEACVPAAFLRPGAFLVQGITSLPSVRAIHRIAVLNPRAFEEVMALLLQWLGRNRCD